MGTSLVAVSIALTSRRTVDLCRVGSCLCRMRWPDDTGRHRPAEPHRGHARL